MEADRWIGICREVTWLSVTGNLLTLAFPTCYFPTQHGAAGKSSTNRIFFDIFDAQRLIIAGWGFQILHNTFPFLPGMMTHVTHDDQLETINQLKTKGPSKLKS